MHDLVIRSGRVALGDDWAECDIGIDDGQISKLGSGLTGNTTIDATGKWVLPGGIDTHCHLDQPSSAGPRNADGFESGSISAAFGGTTCIIPFAMPDRMMSATNGLERALSCAAGRSVVDYGMHAVITPSVGPDLAGQLDQLVQAGVPSIKLYMTYEGFAVNDDLMLAVLDAARLRGMVVMVHAENDAAIRRTRQRLIDLGRRDLRYHAVAHSEVMEREATHRAISLAEIAAARLTIVHVSCRQSAEEVVRGRQRGVDVAAETCPQYLFTCASDLDGEPSSAVHFVFTPPPRSPSSQKHLWAALARGNIDLWSSDHSPYTHADKLGKSGAPAFHQATPGIPGLETRLPLLFSEGLLKGRLSLATYVDLTSRNAARVYGLDHAKGQIAIGLDADLAIWDPARRWRITHDVLHSLVDFTPYEGMTVLGKPITVLVRGKQVIADEALCAQPGMGRFTPRRPNILQNRTPAEDMAPWQHG
jgi:dihydropyrimidinase